MKLRILLLAAILFIAFSSLNAQDESIHPSLVGTGVFLGVTPPLRDMPTLTQSEMDKLAKTKKKEENELNEQLAHRSYPFAKTALPKGPDPVWQKTMGLKSALSNSPIQNFSGQTSPYDPPDCNGAAGPNHFMQTINTVYAIYSKTGTLVAGPTDMNLLFGSVTGSSCNDGDPLVLYDEQAGRWLAVEFSICGSNDYMLIAVSQTNDPTGVWNKYSFDVADMPDYEKFGIWQDGYYMADNNSTGNDIYVFQRSVMLTGGASPQMIAFNNPNRPTSIDGFMCVPPIDNDGTTPAPTGAPGTFIAFNDDAIAGGSDQLWIFELAANWTTPASSTFSRTQQLAVAAFDSDFGNDWTNIAQLSSTQQLDAIPQVIMNVPQYRNFGTYQTIVCCHTVDVDASDHAGVRWYELRRGTQASGNWAIRQQGTYAPDAHSRWMGSIMLNGSGKIGLGYSISSSSLNPGIRYTGQSSSAYNSGAGVMDIPEQTIQTGSYAQTSSERWGDYSLMSVDPSDDQTFWFTTEYVGSGSSHPSKIASFKFGNEPAVVTLAASAVAPTSATLNGTVNPNGLETTYYFQYGTSVGYGNVTTSLSAGSGTTAVSENASISGLTPGTPIHFRLVATNSDGTAYGSDMVFTPGAATVSTTAASLIGMNTATSGGNVTADGGLSITARGVCWATTANPVATGNHTTDGSGTGLFTSSITGLTANTLYHVRAYATNSSGTYYGDDLSFTTLCTVISTFPWTEGFENAGVIPNCWVNEQVASSGINWTFITGSGNSNPAAAHTGTYNACLKDVNTADNKTRLITPSINLSSIGSPQLTFWHTQAVWSGRQDALTVYYRTSATGAWTQLATYTSSITAWTMETISLPNSSSDYYINFEGNAKYGRGICIDDVTIAGTSTLPTVTTTAATSIATTTASSGGNVTAAGGSSVTARGVCWATTADPIVSGSHTTDGSGTGSFTSSITGLSPNTLYHVRAYATNTGGTAYGSDLQFTTLAALPTVTTTTPTSITSTTASSGGNVTADGGATVTARGVCWATTINPVATGSHTTDGTGTGIFTSSITGLSASTPYHVRAYATNSAGTSYGSDLLFTTAATPTLGVTPGNRNVTSSAGATTFSVTSNSSWTSVSDQTWCTVTASGTGNGTITANYTENTSVNSRVANITVTVIGLTPIVVTVTQSGATPTLSVTPSNQAVTTPAGSTAFSVTSNTDWGSTSDQTWCTVTATGSGNGTLTATYSENLTTSTRVANITVTVTGLTPIVVTVTQAGAAVPEFLITAQNIVQTSATTLEFDVYLLDNNASSPFELASTQLGFLFNSGIYTGGSITASSIAGSSELSASQAPTATPSIVSTLAGYPGQTLLRLAGRTPPGAGSGSIISAVSPGTRIIRLKLTSTVPFATSSVLNMVFTSNTVTNPLYATRVNQYVGTTNTPLTVTPGYNANVLEPVPVLNPPPTLTVTPSNRDVLSGAGNTTFTVTSNAGWTAGSNQTWCTVSPSGFGNGTITADYAENTTGSSRVAEITVTVSGLSPIIVTVTQQGMSNKVLNLGLLLQGLYNGSGTMHPAMDESGAHWGLTIADKITVELHDNSNYSNVIYTVSNVELHTDGTASLDIPSIYSGSYYITIRHRNSIETVSSVPVSFSGSPVAYQFNVSTQAYGGNLGMMIDGNWVIYGGDVDQDGFIDTGDMAPVDNDSFNYLSGYLNSDTNGDGVIDTGDMAIVDNNASNYVSSSHP